MGERRNEKKMSRATLVLVVTFLIGAVVSFVYLYRIETQHKQREDQIIRTVLPAPVVLERGLPFLIYGTAWKNQNTAKYVQEAVRAGFRFIDTACQPKHYNEAGVGDGWVIGASQSGINRTDLYLQTKYTSMRGQDPNRLPYDPNATKEEQIKESLQVSLSNLQTDYLDAWIMHSPERTIDETMRVYAVMEQAVDNGTVARLGLSNCNYDTFTKVYAQARIKPVIVQNPFTETHNWDADLREFCQQHNIWYQSFWTLTGERQREVLKTKEVEALAKSKSLTPQTLLYAYLLVTGYGRPLSGTRNPLHMMEDVAVMVRLQEEQYAPLNNDSSPSTISRVFADEHELRQFEELLGVQ